jgi:hypothetical protein
MLNEPLPYSRGHRKRVSRIQKRAAPEVVRAFQQGLISAKRADLWLYLPVEQQQTQLQAYLSERETISQRSKIAAEIIQKHLALGQRDLVALREDLHLALASSTIQTHA